MTTEEWIRRNCGPHCYGEQDENGVDLIRVKEHIGRARDRDSLYQLLAIKRIRQEEAEKGGP